MRDRTREILEAGVRQFIKTGLPITSERLFEEYDFGIKPAMIRCELNALDEEGYLEQGHPSGGRRPTHKAYKFFVDGLLSEKEESSRRVRQAFGTLVSLFEQERKMFIEHVADAFDSLIAGYEPKREEFYGSGLSDLMTRMELDSKDEILQIVEDFENLSSRIEEERRWWEQESSWPQVFIGGSPLTRSRNTSIIVERFDRGNEKFFFVMLGPTRMDYQKSIHFFKTLEQSFVDKKEK